MRIKVELTDAQWEAVMGCLSVCLQSPWDGPAFGACGFDTTATTRRRIELARTADRLISQTVHKALGNSDGGLKGEDV